MNPLRTPLSRHTLTCAGVLACLCVAATSAASGAGRLAPLRVDSERAAALRRAYWQHRTTLPEFLHDTRRNARLQRHGLLTQPARQRVRLERRKAGIAALPDTVRVLMVRVGFETNRAPRLTSMDASGDFFMAPDSTARVDPPPHDVAYFESHSLAMRSYYDVMSRGQLVLDTRVFPPAGEPSIKLTDVADYGPGSAGVWTLESLEQYFRDCVELLDRESVGRLDLEPYAYDSTGTRLGAIVFVHPGSDLQNDVNRDSPNDLPTFYITLADSVPIDAGAREVRNGLIIPETTSQDGLLGGIQGALNHEFGHALGLPDWYSTFTGLPVIGEWSLMDSGSAPLQAWTRVGEEDDPIFALGVLPTSLSAVDRYFLGWLEPYEVHAPEDVVQLRPANADEALSSSPTAALLPISPDEYFILENRRDLHVFRLGDHEICPYFNQDPATGVILWMSKDDPAIPNLLRRNSGEYDFWIAAPTAPDSAAGPCGELGYGVIVWHVDERPILEGLETNTVNVSFTHRAKRVIEASGDFEIGDFNQPTVSFLGDGWNDPFREGYKDELRQDTVPNNWNSDWARTGWEIVEIRNSGAESHAVTVRVLDGVAGWPRRLEVAPDTLAQIVPEGAVVGSVTNLGPRVVVADSGTVRSFGATSHEIVHTGVVEPRSLAWARFASDTDATLGAVVDARVFLWSARWNGSGLDARPGFPLDVPAGAGARLTLSARESLGLVETQDAGWVLFDADGTIVDLDVDRGNGVREAGVVVGPLSGAWPGDEAALIDASGVTFVSLRDTSLRSRVSLGLDADPGATLFVGGGALDASSMNAQVVVLHEDGRLRVVDPVDGVLPGFRDLPPDTYLGMALGDVDGDGYVDVLAASASELVGVNSLGATLFATPRNVREIFAVQDEVRIVTPPLLVDVTSDALPEVMFSTNLGLLYVLDASGALVPGYPRKALPDLTPSAVLAADLDGAEASLEVIGVSPSNISGFALPGGGSGSPGWASLGGGPGRTAFASPDSAATDARERVLALERPFMAYPNPARQPVVKLRIAARAAGPYEIRIYNLEGEQVWENRGVTVDGVQEVTWDAGALASGVYLCRFVSAAAGVSAPMVEPITLVR